MGAIIPLFASGVVGSMPRSQFVRDLLDPEKTPSDKLLFEKCMNGAVDYILALQEMAGLDIVSDGEYRRRSYIGIIADVCDGFLLERKDGAWWHTVIAPMKHMRPGGAAKEAAYQRARTKRLIKVALPSPYLLGQRMWSEEKSRNAYSTREAFMEALVPILRAEFIAVRDAGADIVQFDDPHLCLFVDEKVRGQFADPQREIDLCVDMLNAILDGVNGVHTAIHLCRRNKARKGWVGEGGYDPILGALKRLNVDQYVMEFTIPVAGDLSVLKELPEKASIGLGCVDCRGETIDSVETIVARVEKALQYLPPQRILLNPDCGFAPGSAAEIPIDEAYAKLCNEAEAGRQLRERYG
ncbi:MAG: cobalamin-independent methionine synthase II family protein [Candidatus Hydrogenedentes bacterium]|nr:cobalamin-independent methionine synthase II family protein [Candidatus Hydrogenedentota bacterium]